MRILITPGELILKGKLDEAVEMGIMTKDGTITGLVIEETGEMILNESQATKLGIHWRAEQDYQAKPTPTKKFDFQWKKPPGGMMMQS